jgi:hypothetical protein
VELDAPHLKCVQSDINTTIPTPLLVTENEGILRNYSDDFSITYKDANLTVDFIRYLGYIPQRHRNLSNFVNITYGVAAQIHRFTCEAYSAVYRVNITNRDDSQNVTYQVYTNRSLNYINNEISFTWTDKNNELDSNRTDWGDYDNEKRSIVPRESVEYKEWARHQVTEYLRALNAYSLFQYAFERIMGSHGTFIHINISQGVQCIENGWLVGNETHNQRVSLCPMVDLPVLVEGIYDPLPIEQTALNKRRFDGEVFDPFEPLEDLNISSASLNQLLANFSISALNLNTFFDNVTVDVEELRNVYHFTEKVGFIVPYALCFAIALVYALVALRALRMDGKCFPGTKWLFSRKLWTSQKFAAKLPEPSPVYL